MEKKTRHRLYQFVVVLTLVLVFPCLFGRAQGFSLSDATVSNSSRDLLAYFNLRNSFDPDTRKALLTGLTVRFVFDVRLYRVEHLWTNTLLASLNLEHSIRYDGLKEEFLVDLGGRKIRFKELPEAVPAVSDVSGLPVIPLARLATHHTYQLQIKAARRKDPTPSVFNYLMSFLSFWETDTDSCTVEFKY